MITNITQYSSKFNKINYYCRDYYILGGPKIPMKYGRIDALSPEDCAPDGNLPGTI